MGSEELGANIFRITQTEARLKRDNLIKAAIDITQKNNKRLKLSTSNFSLFSYFL